MWQSLEQKLISRGIRYQRTEFPSEMFTSKAVAKALGMTLSQIAKAMLVRTSDGAYAIALLGGDRRLNLKALPRFFKGKKAVLAQRSEILAATGLPAGAVTPLIAFLRPDISVVMDEALLREQMINISSGDLRVGLNISPEVLARAVGAVIGNIAE